MSLAVSGKSMPCGAFRLARFAELRDLLRGVSEKVLTAQLRELERDGIVKRREVRSSPPKVTYSLSPAGQTLIPVLKDLCDWGSKQFGIKPNLPRPPHSANHS